LIEDEEAYIQNFPLWIKIWEASIVLTEYLSRAGIEMDASILELGAGMGLTGLLLGAMGHRVTLSDYNDDALALLEKNAAHNKLNNVLIQKLDWLKPDMNDTYDIIFGSELIYKEEFIDPVLALLKKALKPGGTVYIAHDVNRKIMVEFLKRADHTFMIQSIVKTMKTDGQEHKVVIHRLQLK
jgi:predicted nicotinamide N-methyase